MKTPKGRGRPRGAKTIKELVEVKASRCLGCGSTKRTDYKNTYYRDYSGQGLPFIGIHYRACSCEDCGRPRRDLEKVYPPAAENSNRNAIIEPSQSVDHA